MISRSIKVIYGFEPPRIGAASPSSVRNPYLTFLSSRIHLRFKPFGALGNPKWKQGQGRFSLYYRFQTTFAPVSTMRLKIEINTREHFSFLDVAKQRFTVDNPWFKGTTDLPVYQLDELLGTKMRALYQRKKGRDLYDLSMALRSKSVDSDRVIKCFRHYMKHDRLAVSRAEYEANLAAKLQSKVFLGDIQLLIRADSEYNPIAAADIVQSELIAKLPGNPWKGEIER